MSLNDPCPDCGDVHRDPRDVVPPEGVTHHTVTLEFDVWINREVTGTQDVADSVVEFGVAALAADMVRTVVEATGGGPIPGVMFLTARQTPAEPLPGGDQGFPGQYL